VYPAFKGATASDSDYGSTLKDLRETFYKQVITGAKSIDEWDSFVSQFKKSGGDVLTKEVNAAMK
jgi:putative aldouronate transport system substrate-binding protein